MTGAISVLVVIALLLALAGWRSACLYSILAQWKADRP